MVDNYQHRDQGSVFHYLKFLLPHGTTLASCLFLTLGGAWMMWGLIIIVVAYCLLDYLLGDDISMPRYRFPAILTLQLWLALPLLGLNLFCLVWQGSSTDPLHYGAMIADLTGYDMFAARQAMSLTELSCGIALSGLLSGMLGIIIAHELIHRVHDPVSLVIGRWLLACSFTSNAAVEHLYGHHRYAATDQDPATAPRGRNVYAHVVRSSFGCARKAWQIELARLQVKKLPIWSWRNRVLRGYLMSSLLVLLVWLMAGWNATLVFVITGLWGKSLLEIVNYIEHYGLLRDPGCPVQIRHSWNTNKRFSSWAMVNLTRHSHHHAQGSIPFHELTPCPQAPSMLGGYFTTMSIALIPPLWHHLMAPRLLDWDQRYASDRERALAATANRRSGLRSLQGYAAADCAEAA